MIARIQLVFASILAVFATSAMAQQAAVPSAETIVESESFQRARDSLDSNYDLFVKQLIALTEIPAPPFKETARAEVYADHFRKLGLKDVTIDAEGNVLGLRPGSDPDAGYIVLSAHLDTVFPEGTPVKVRREGTKLFAPGVGDDTRGLATLLAYVRALDAAEIVTRRSILFVGTVGEEGRGDLRGARYLFTEGAYKDRIAGFFSLDGNNAARVTHQAVGSKRYRISFKGPGGHSYGAFGIVNPMAAMAAAITELYKITPPTKPKTTYSASVTGGGTAVNAIPNEVFVDVDMRSEGQDELASLDRRFLQIVKDAVASENDARATDSGEITFEAEVIGQRPAGATPTNAPIVRATVGAIEAMGLEPDYYASSTDSNIPMSIGVPAVTIGYGGEGGRSHSLDEFVDVEKTRGVRDMSVGLIALLGAAEIELQ